MWLPRFRSAQSSLMVMRATPLYSVRNDIAGAWVSGCDVTNLVHSIRSNGSIAIIGVGGSPRCAGGVASW